MQLLGLTCLVMVVLTHVAEAYRVFPAMGWGRPTSAGHYLDLVSAILGFTLLPLGFLGSAITQAPMRFYRRVIMDLPQSQSFRSG
jgi:hypothetical protein